MQSSVSWRARERATCILCLSRLVRDGMVICRECVDDAKKRNRKKSRNLN
jgi:hypothetical protein